MKKVFIVLGFFLLLSMDKSPELRETVTFYSIGELATALENEEVYNFPSRWKDGEPRFLMTKPYIDVVVEDKVYGSLFLYDDTLRYIFHLSQYYKLDIFFILAMAQYDLLDRSDGVFVSSSAIQCSALKERTRWASRIRSLGTPEKDIFSKYRELPDGFFQIYNY